MSTMNTPFLKRPPECERAICRSARDGVSQSDVMYSELSALCV